eukprot:scaffold156478_cov28-Tisochrysis_lutea.AAC.3
MALPPCHMFAQFYVANGELSCQVSTTSLRPSSPSRCVSCHPVLCASPSFGLLSKFGIASEDAGH